MAKRRSRGDGSLYWNEDRQRWIAEVTVGYTPAGKRIYRKASGKTKTEAKKKLDDILRDHSDGVLLDASNYTVADAVGDWLLYGLNGRQEARGGTGRSSQGATSFRRSVLESLRR